MYFLIINLSQYIPEALKQNLWLILLICCLSLAVGIMVGYLLGNRSLKKDYEEAFESERHMGTIQKSIAENVGLGIIVYGKDGVLYSNNTITEFAGFIDNGKIPGDLNIFLDKYDNKDNHLKSDYLVSIENGADLVRSNYMVNNKIYEIKILKRTVDYEVEDEKAEAPESEVFDIVIVEDITQIKDDERRQKDLAANVSHELKTPLTVIRASEIFVQKLRSPQKPTYDEIEKWGNRILANAIRMQDIVEDFLVLSMSTQTKQMRIFEVFPMVEKAISNLNDYPNADKVRIVSPKNAAYPLGFGNSRLIMRVVTNLLTNAVKYIDYDGKDKPNEIVINIVTTADKIGIQVDDNGRGIPEKDIDHLFERFYRVDNSGSRDVGGSGLGLAIAREIAENHDGNISIVSKLNSGSSFTLFLPTAKSCFERIYEDAKDGVISEIPYYKAVTDFFFREEIEAARSKGYNDIVKTAEEMRIDETGEKFNESDEIKLISLLGDDRFKDLCEELTYVDVFDDEDEEDYGDEEEEIEEDEVIETEVQEENEMTEAEEAAADAYATEVLEAYEKSMLELQIEEQNERIAREQEEFERQKKKEVQEFLMQPVVQQSMKQTKIIENVTKKDEQNVNNGDFVRLEDKDKTVIHPNSEKKLYNGTSGRLFEGKKKSSPKKIKGSEETEPIRSAVKQVLDEASAIEDKIAKNNDEGNR